jgi:RNA polymerase sigma factor for flagellar operon FliA
MPERTTTMPNIDTWKQWREKGLAEAREELITAYTPLVRYVSGRLLIGLPRHLSQDDLFGYGIIGLIDAIEKFDYQRGLQFETYASWRIRGSILDAIRKGDWVPRSVRENAKKLENAYLVLEQEHLRSADDDEVCEYLHITSEEYQKMIQETSVTSLFSLDEPIGEEEQETRLSLLIDPNVLLPEKQMDREFLKETLAKAIDRLTPKERTVVSLFYYEELGLSEIAEVMSLSPSRISQLHSKAILRLRGALGRMKKQLF